MTHEQVSELYKKAVNEWNNLTERQKQSNEGLKLLGLLKELSDKLKSFDKAISPAA